MWFRKSRDPLRQLERLENARSAMATWTSATPAESATPTESVKRRLFRSHKAS